MTLATTLFPAPSITETELSPELATYIVFVSSLTPIPTGSFPTVIGFPITLLVAPSITETVLSLALVTYILFVSIYSPKTPIPTGCFPTVMCATCVGVRLAVRT